MDGCRYPSRRIGGVHAFLDFGAAFAFHLGDVVLALQVEPELGAVAELTGKAERRVGADRSSGIEDVGNAA